MELKGKEILWRSGSLCAVLLAVGFLLFLLVDVTIDGIGRLNYDFFVSFSSRRAARAGILSPLVGTLWLLFLTCIFAVPVGIGAALYLEEFASNSRFTRFLELNIANLAGIPSIIYGILGLQLFVRVLSFERSLLAGAATLSLLVLPIIIISSREALRQIPQSYRDASVALGATKCQTVWFQVLPYAMPGIVTGCIFALSRAVGETAPLIAIGALTYAAFVPMNPASEFTALPIQAYNWINRPQESFHENAAAAILVLLMTLALMNGVAILIRYLYQHEKA